MKTKFKYRYQRKGGFLDNTKYIFVAEDNCVWVQTKDGRTTRVSIVADECEKFFNAGVWKAWFSVINTYKRKNGHTYNKSYWVLK